MIKKCILWVFLLQFLVSCEKELTLPHSQAGKAPEFPEGYFADDFTVNAIPADLQRKYAIDCSYYSKYTMVWGIPITACSDVDDIYLKNTAELVGLMLSDESLKEEHASLIRDLLYQNMFRISVYPSNNVGTKQLPEYKQYSDADAYGAMRDLPLIGFSERNVTECLGGSGNQGRLKQGNSLVHEIMHSIHLFAGNEIMPGFDKKLKAAYENAKSQGRWDKNFYIIDTNEKEYLAEGAEIWFNWEPYTLNRGDEFVRVNQDDLLEMDPALYEILSVFFQPKQDVMDQISFCSHKVILTFNPLSFSDTDYSGTVSIHGDGELIESSQFTHSTYEMSLTIPDPSASYISFENYTFTFELVFDDENSQAKTYVLNFSKEELLGEDGFPNIELNVVSE